MFGIGFQELVLLSLIGLIVLGPERLPRVASQLGNWLGQARRMTRVMKRQLEDEINFEQHLNIKPPDREPSSQPPQAPADHDDDYSAAHAKGERGIDDDLAVTTADRSDKDAPADTTAAATDDAVVEEEAAKESS